MNPRIRSVLFWLHLAAGLLAGLVIFVMCVTGTLLMYERQVVEWADRGFRADPPSPGAAPLPVETLLAKVRAAEPGPTPPSGVTRQADPAAPVLVSLGRERSLYVDPYSGKILGEASPRIRAFFRAVTDWHRWLGAKDDSREPARKVTGISNLAFLFLVLSGIFLWLPRKWTRRQVRIRSWFRRGVSGKARDFNWHHAIGIWSWLPLVLIVSTGVVMSFPWANALLFRLAGDEPPRQAGPSGPGGGSGPQGGERRGGERGERGNRGERGQDELQLDGLDEMWAAAERQAAERMPGWQSLSLRIPTSAEAPVTFNVTAGDRGRPDLRAQLTFDRSTGEAK
ncbi:MAG TPA: PepSY-associated TM helix domain-containing protein, partial [Thermoanaerobaculia bacterium]|nr:PepSY-associated TM helix domain-containing protein [Thermoanaerobaculia bacterium]